MLKKNDTFSDSLFAALQPLEVAEYVEIAVSAKSYTRKLLSNWNKQHDTPKYVVKSLLQRENNRPVTKIVVQRVK